MGNLSLDTEPKRDKEEKRDRRRQAIKALEALLAQVRKWCDTLERLEQWYDTLQKVRHLFSQWEDDLPARACKRLQQALERAERVKENLSRACDILQKDLEAVIKMASSPGFLGLSTPAAIGVGSALVVVVASGIAVAIIVPPLLRDWVTVTVRNDCPQVLEFSTSGIEPPQGSIGAFSSQSFEVPAVEVSASRDVQTLAVSALGRGFDISLAPEMSVRWNDTDISPDFDGSFDLGEQAARQLVVTCP